MLDRGSCRTVLETPCRVFRNTTFQTKLLKSAETKTCSLKSSGALIVKYTLPVVHFYFGWLDAVSTPVICPDCRAGDATASLITHTERRLPGGSADQKTL